MLTELFDYHLPNELIAQVPTTERDQSKLLVVNRSAQTISHHLFNEIDQFLTPGDCLIRNSARVIPARLFAQRVTGGKVECFLLRPATEENQWWCLLKPGKKLPIGSVFGMSNEFQAKVLEKNEKAEFRVQITPEKKETIHSLAERIGHIPLPPYISRKQGDQEKIEKADRSRYQTVYSNKEESVAVAAPTAGLHFTEALLQRLERQQIAFADLYLHVGLGTFRPIETSEIEEHPIHRELYEIPALARKAIEPGSYTRRIAVGTTTVRSIEDYTQKGNIYQNSAHLDEAGIFIYPPFEFRATDALITNFHLPQSTLLCLLSAFLTPGSTDGIAWFKDIYKEAIREKYRFLSYGDAMLIL
ncbi:MAG: tRNA preQ1(34) S-adenosylmethionine ribosyltransferase-isomerase QueA [Opitutaceae bacterium]|nr:tRNA preQ1(34) S-adenosylmethionine ribosyltransferase-isomerase QueA [Opitutaceae bacterium]